MDTRDPSTSLRARSPADLHVLAAAGMFSLALLLVVAASFVPGLLDDRGGLLPVCFAGGCLLVLWMVVRGTTSRSVGPLAFALLLAGSGLVASFEDPVSGAIAAAWVLVLPMYLGPRMSPRLQLAYFVTCVLSACALVAALPAQPLPDVGTAVVTLRVVLVGCLLTFPLLYLRSLLRRLDDALVRARDLAGTDALTGLLNRRGLDVGFSLLTARRGDPHDRLAVLALDLDHFKRVNDAHGHAEGDDALVTVTRAVLAGCRPGDLVARIGGEELCVVTVVGGEDDARARAEELREQVRSAGRTWGLTTSVGIALASGRGAAGQGPQDDSQGGRLLAGLLAAADQRLYEAKEAGRDRVRGPGAAATPRAPDRDVAARHDVPAPARPAAAPGRRHVVDATADRERRA
ncbi:GGDEF domain-containing protein [Pseudokineococcus sp. 1T1Z-3]|uniref:GGDEF domain-containing protein n=1 Tax=Pseudokineococcus sp. 1T1Z-3 TaxID=3132745 RepID=UPI0030A680FC